GADRGPQARGVPATRISARRSQPARARSGACSGPPSPSRRLASPGPPPTAARAGNGWSGRAPAADLSLPHSDPLLSCSALIQPRRYMDRPLLWAAAVAGLSYGLLVRLYFGLDAGKAIFGVMSIAFLFGVPLVLGFLVVAIAERRQPIPWLLWLVVPWGPALLSLVAALGLAWEGLICLWLWVPLFMVLSSLGGVLAGIWRRLQRRHV